jgi:hypothetical protein
MHTKSIAAVFAVGLVFASFGWSAPGAGSAAAVQNVPKVLSSTDIDAFIANFNKIDIELSALGDKYDELFSGPEDSSPAVLSAAIHSSEVPPEVQSVFRKYGLGNNGFEKVMVITLGFTLLEMDDMLALQAKDGQSADVKASIDAALDQIKGMKSAIHSSDLALVDARREQLRPALTDIEREMSR